MVCCSVRFLLCFARAPQSVFCVFVCCPPSAHLTPSPFTLLDPQLRHLRREVSATSRENELLSFFLAHRLGDGEDLESLEGAGVDMFGDGDVVPSRLTQTQLLDVAKGCVEDIKAESILAKEKSLGALSTLHVVVTQAGLRLEGSRAVPGRGRPRAARAPARRCRRTRPTPPRGPTGSTACSPRTGNGSRRCSRLAPTGPARW